MLVETVPFDAAELIENREAAALFMADALETGDAGYVAHALGVLARAKGMKAVADAAGLGRESLYKALKEDANPKFETILKVVHALGLRLTAAPAGTEAA